MPNRIAEPGIADIQLQVGAGVGRIPPETQLREWIAAALGAQSGFEVTLRIVAEPESAELNRRYRNRDCATNVLSFPAAPDWPAHDGEPRSLGDLVVCAPVIEREAREQGKPIDAHWAHIVIHGALHLLGHDHETDGDAVEMERRERELLSAFGFEDPYAPRL